jgi:hypothetical protein
MPRKRRLADKLNAGGVAARGSSVKTTAPAAGDYSGDSSRTGFVQTRGTRANQSYVVKRGPSGQPIRVYDDGSNALATGGKQAQVGAKKGAGAALQRARGGAGVSDIAKMAEIYARLLKKTPGKKYKVRGGRTTTRVPRGTGGTAAP